MSDRSTTRLKDLFDVAILSPSNSQGLTYNVATGRWENKAASNAGTGAFSLTCQWFAGLNPNGQILLIVSQSVLITSIVGRLETANSGASTMSVVKAASGTALAAGTALHSGSFNAQGTPAANQTLTVLATLTLAYQSTNGAYEPEGAYMNQTQQVRLNVGDSIGIQTTGVFDTSSGCITVTGTYQ